jgi:hypothetical protein
MEGYAVKMLKFTEEQFAFELHQVDTGISVDEAFN